MRRGQWLLTSPCPLWRLASASWCHVATGPSLLRPSSVNLLFLSSLTIHAFFFMFSSTCPQVGRQLGAEKQRKGCLHVGKILHIKLNIWSDSIQYAGHIPLVLWLYLGLNTLSTFNMSSRAQEAVCQMFFEKSDSDKAFLILSSPPPILSPPPVVQMTRNWSTLLCWPNVLYCHWSETRSEGMYWTMCVLVPVYQAMC